MGTTTHDYTGPCTILNRVAREIAHTCRTAIDSRATAVDGESLQGHAARVLNVHDRQASAGKICDGGTILGNQRQSIHALNHYVVFAAAYNSYRIRPLRIATCQKLHGLVNRFFLV